MTSIALPDTTRKKKMLGMLTIEGQLKLDHVQVIVTKFQMSSCIKAELFSTSTFQFLLENDFTRFFADNI